MPKGASRAFLRRLDAWDMITLTTDFGRRDWFAGTLHGVIAGISPDVRVVDLTHEIAPGDIQAGAFVLMNGWRHFPKGTIHVAIVDPGVGGVRFGLAIRTASGFFIGPDNGLLSWAVRGQRIQGIVRLDNPRWFLPEVSHTFHGRDVFAPVAAHLSRGVSWAKLGAETSDFVKLPWPEPQERRGGWIGQILYVDRFGNGITNLPNDLLGGKGAGPGQLRLARRRIPIRACYEAVPAGSPVAVEGSTGFLELAINGGSALDMLGAGVGKRVEFIR